MSDDIKKKVDAALAAGRIKYAPEDEARTLKPYVDQIMAALDIEPLFISDISTFLDFVSPLLYPTREDAQRELDTLLVPLGLGDGTVSVEDTIVSAARLLAQKDQRPM